MSNAKASLSLLSSNVVAIIQKYHTGKMTAVFHVFDGGGHALFDGFPQTLLEWKIEEKLEITKRLESFTQIR